MTYSGVCLRAMIREFPPVSIHETHINTGLLHGTPTKPTFRGVREPEGQSFSTAQGDVTGRPHLTPSNPIR